MKSILGVDSMGSAATTKVWHRKYARKCQFQFFGFKTLDETCSSFSELPDHASIQGREGQHLI